MYDRVICRQQHSFVRRLYGHFSLVPSGPQVTCDIDLHGAGNTFICLFSGMAKTYREWFLLTNRQGLKTARQSALFIPGCTHKTG